MANPGNRESNPPLGFISLPTKTKLIESSNPAGMVGGGYFDSGGTNPACSSDPMIALWE